MKYVYFICLIVVSCTFVSVSVGIPVAAGKQTSLDPRGARRRREAGGTVNFLNIRTPKNFVVITLKFGLCGSTIE